MFFKILSLRDILRKLRAGFSPGNESSDGYYYQPIKRSLFGFTNFEIFYWKSVEFEYFKMTEHLGSI